METRRTVLGDDGVVREFVDYDGDGHIDRTLTRQRTGRTLLETLADADGRVLSTRTTDFAANGGPVHRSADFTGDGGTDFEVTWSADGATAEVVRWSPTGGRWEVARSTQSTTEDGQHIDLVEADRWDDGSLDWAARFATFEGLFVSTVQNIGGTVISMSMQLQSTCPSVVPRIAAPPLRERCPYRGYQTCDTLATFDEPVEVVDTSVFPAP